MLKNKRTCKHSTSFTAKIGIILLVLIIAGSVAFYLHHRQQQVDSRHISNGTSAASSKSTINFKPPTAQDKTIVDQNKQAISDTAPASTSSGLTHVTPTITRADKSGVSAYVVGIFENGGTCTATLTGNGQTITKVSSGFENASYTQCAPIDLSSTDLASHSWSVTVSYSSATASGTSQSENISQ